jgi:hypothetical protein
VQQRAARGAKENRDPGRHPALGAAARDNGHRNVGGAIAVEVRDRDAAGGVHSEGGLLDQEAGPVVHQEIDLRLRRRRTGRHQAGRRDQQVEVAIVIEICCHRVLWAGLPDDRGASHRECWRGLGRCSRRGGGDNECYECRASGRGGDIGLHHASQEDKNRATRLRAVFARECRHLPHPRVLAAMKVVEA